MFPCNLVVSDVTAATGSKVSMLSVTNNFFNIQYLKLDNAIGLKTRESVIFECPLNGLFHDIMTVIITSRMAVRESDDDDDEHPLFVRNCQHL